MDVDHGQLVGRHLNRFAVVISLDKLAPVGGRSPGRRDWRRLERFAKVCENLPDRPWLRDEGNEPDVATAVRALERKLLAHPGQEFRPGNSRRVVRAGLLIRVAAASGAVTVVFMPAGRGLGLLADVPDRERRDGPPERVVRCKHPVIPMPVLPRRRHESGEPVEELKRREFDDAVGAGPVDGRQPGFSEGMSEHDLATLMQQIGCFSGLNLDGGGSSIMLVADPRAVKRPPARAVNSPSGWSRRPLPMLLGVRRRAE